MTVFILVLTHFWADWFFQSHDTAMKKSTNAWIRFKHSLAYGLCFVPVLVLLGMERNSLPLYGSFAILVGSHFIEDTYTPVYLWAKYIRRIPQLQPMDSWLQKNKLEGVVVIPPREMFKQLWGTPIGVVLFVTIDQLIHLTCLVPVIWLLTHQ